MEGDDFLVTKCVGLIGPLCEKEYVGSVCTSFSPLLRPRYELLRHIKWIHRIAEDTPYSPTIEMLDELGCDFAVHGDDMPVNEHVNAADPT